MTRQVFAERARLVVATPRGRAGHDCIWPAARNPVIPLPWRGSFDFHVRRPVCAQSVSRRRYGLSSRSQHVGVANHRPRTTCLPPQNGHGASSSSGPTASRQWQDTDCEVGPTVSQVPRDLDFLHYAGRFDPMAREQSAKTTFEGSATSHRRTARGEKNNVVGHQAKHGVNIPGGGGAVPERNEIANGLLV